jgi:hypothetical protein
MVLSPDAKVTTGILRKATLNFALTAAMIFPSFGFIRYFASR